MLPRAKRKLGRLASLSKARAQVCEISVSRGSQTSFRRFFSCRRSMSLTDEICADDVKNLSLWRLIFESARRKRVGAERWRRFKSLRSRSFDKVKSSFRRFVRSRDGNALSIGGQDKNRTQAKRKPKQNQCTSYFAPTKTKTFKKASHKLAFLISTSIFHLLNCA